MKNQIKLFFVFTIILTFFSCTEKVEEKSFVFNGETFLELTKSAINGDEKSKNILNGLFTFDAKLNSFNKIDVDSIEINNSNYYTLLLENQNPVYNLFVIVDKDLNLILKDESLNGYLDLNFKKSGSRRFAVITEDFNSKDVIELKRVSYYSLEEYSSDLLFREFTKIKTPNKEAEQVISVILDTAIVTNIFYPFDRTSRTSKDIFKFDVASNKYVSDNNLFDSLVVKEIRSLKVQTKNPQITDGESILRFFNNLETNTLTANIKLNEKDFEIVLDSTWKKLTDISISNLVTKKLNGIKFISSSLGAQISLAAIAPTDSTENYFSAELKSQDQSITNMRSSDKMVNNKNIFQLFEFSCPTKKILMIIETPKSTYDLNKIVYEEIIKSFLIKC